MKKLILLSVLAALCLNFRVIAQSTGPNRALSIGDQVPDTVFRQLLNYPEGHLRLSDFRGKLLILDFWATYCAPCIGMIPKMEELQNQFEGKLQFISVAHQSANAIEPFLKRYEAQMHVKPTVPMIFNDRLIEQWFPHRTLPHYVWIDANGKIAANTELFEINAKNITQFLSDPGLKLAQKVDAPLRSYNPDTPLLLRDRPGESNGYLSVFAPFVDGIGAGLVVLPQADTKGWRITVYNNTILRLFQIAYRDRGMTDKNRVIMEVREPELLTNVAKRHGNELEAWGKDGHMFTYELITDSTRATQLYDLMRKDVQGKFRQYVPRLEIRKVRSLVLITTTDLTPYVSLSRTTRVENSALGIKLTAQPLSFLTTYLGNMYGSLYKMPVLDGTDFKQPVDLQLEADMRDVKSVNRALKAYGLELIEKEVDTEMLVISDRDPKP